MTAAPRAHTRRLFFGVWPDPAERAALAASAGAAVAASGGRAVPAENLHLTLLFLGSTAPERIAALEGLARRVAQAAPEVALELSFDALAWWRQPRILCALTPEPPAALVTLAAALRDAAVAAGFSPDLKPFRAHVTVARKVARAPAQLALDSVTWRHRTLALIESRTGVAGPVYSVLESWLLGKAEKVRTQR